MASAVTDSTFSTEVLQSPGYILVDFWAEWCGPCRMLAPVLEKLSTQYAGKLNVLKLDTDANPESAQKYQITSIPCCILFKDGQEVKRFVGFRNETQFSADLQPFVG
jgi:thioredoxin 1